MTDQTYKPGADHDSGVPLRDHEFDGIQEFDNKLPNWWLWTFWVACIFSIFYWMWAHGLGFAPTDREHLAMQLQARAEAAPDVDVSPEALLLAAEDPAIVASGQEVFTTNCAACHGANGNGMIVAGVPGAGPNLTDEFWIHGGRPEDIHKTIAEGYLPKAMPAWLGPLGPTKVRDAAAYVLSIRGTNVEGGKEPQGEKFTPED